MTNDLRRFIDGVKRQTGDLLEIDKPVRPHEFEVTALLKQLEDKHRYPMVLFRQPTDMYGKPSRFPLLSNVYSTRERCAVMLGVDPSTPNYEVSQAFARKVERKIAPVSIKSEDAPVHENVWRGVEADIGKLPIVKHFAMDMGPVLTMAHIMKSASEDFYNVSFAKTFYKWAPHEMVVSLHTPHMTRLVREGEARNEAIPIINVIGAHPAFYLGSLAKNPWGANDYETLGSFLDEPLRLAPSVTWGDKFMVPADAEIIIEGEIPPGQRDVCDPFGEVARLYQAQCLRPLFQVKAITFRNGAIVQDIFSGFRDSFPLGAIPKEGTLENEIRKQIPNLHQIHVPDSSCGVYAAYISVKDARPELAPEIGRIAFETFMPLQCVVVVDSDIDVFEESQVFWAIHTYSNFAKSFHTRGNWPGGRLIQHEGGSGNGPQSGFATTNWGGKVVIDATRPNDFAFGLRSEIPAEVMARVRLSDFLPAGAGE
ncbi:MAG TPA: UbiD family decarboxylase [Stellaceae bacterium]|nr:UbiD family decarboxylase [Stellaceae bacterium]